MDAGLRGHFDPPIAQLSETFFDGVNDFPHGEPGGRNLLPAEVEQLFLFHQILPRFLRKESENLFQDL
jgi:hypothetical protein